MKGQYGSMIAVPLVIFSFAAAARPAAAQEALDCGPIYQKFLDNRTGPELEKYRSAVSAGKEYLEKCSGVEGQEEIKAYVTDQVPKIAEIVKTQELVSRFIAAVPAKNWTDAVSSGKELVAMNHRASLDVMIVLASIGYLNAMADPAADDAAADTIATAKAVLKKLDEGAKSDTYGLFQFGYKTKDCPDGKANAASWMNNAIGRITYSRPEQQRSALPYLFAAHKTGCELKNDPEIYRLIGKWYFDEAESRGRGLAEKIEKSGGEESDEIKTLDALINGYLERAIDAYSRAYSTAKINTKLTQAYKDELYKKLERLYDLRYDGKRDGMEEAIAKVNNTPFPDPESEVKPVFDPPMNLERPAAGPAKKP